MRVPRLVTAAVVAVVALGLAGCNGNNGGTATKGSSDNSCGTTSNTVVAGKTITLTNACGQATCDASDGQVIVLAVLADKASGVQIKGDGSWTLIFRDAPGKVKYEVKAKCGHHDSFKATVSGANVLVNCTYQHCRQSFAPKPRATYVISGTIKCNPVKDHSHPTSIKIKGSGGGKVSDSSYNKGTGKFTAKVHNTLRYHIVSVQGCNKWPLATDILKQTSVTVKCGGKESPDPSNSWYGCWT